MTLGTTFLKVHMIAIHNIEKIQFENENMIIQVDGVELRIPLDKLSIRLKNANDLERNMYKITPSGYGIHWPLIDEDLSIEGILRDFGN